MLLDKLKDKKLILGSQSPRRKELLASLNFPFETIVKEVDESFPSELPVDEVASYISRAKADAFTPTLNEIIITSDTVVCCDQQILGKPADSAEAFEMISMLSNKSHKVITGVTIRSSDKEVTFSDTTTVWFKALSKDEIHFYVENYKPLDKAGAYGIQEWIGQIGITRIDGSYFNVMGLPIHRVYEELLKFC